MQPLSQQRLRTRRYELSGAAALAFPVIIICVNARQMTPTTAQDDERMQAQRAADLLREMPQLEGAKSDDTARRTRIAALCEEISRYRLPIIRSGVSNYISNERRINSERIDAGWSKIRVLYSYLFELPDSVLAPWTRSSGGELVLTGTLSWNYSGPEYPALRLFDEYERRFGARAKRTSTSRPQTQDSLPRR